MYPSLAASPGSMPSVLCAFEAVSAVPWLFVADDGVLIVTPHTTKPLAPSATWNFGALCRVIRYSVKRVAPLTRTSVGIAAAPFVAAFVSHHDCVWPTSGSPPWPSMTPSPTIAWSAPATVMTGVQEPPLVPQVAP